jgi:hypothetical protein
MDDRTLLELAAKAAGIELRRLNCGGPSGQVWLSDKEIWVHGWNPLTDDGDALRLAVKLKIDFKCYGENVRTWGDPVAQKVLASVEELCGSDPYAATRRAITRAAAAIGESK